MTLMALFHRACMVLCPEKCPEILKFSFPERQFLVCSGLNILLLDAVF